MNLFFENITHRIELSLIWSKERIEILWYDTKDWIFLIWLTEPNTFQHNSKKWTFFSNWLKEVNFFLQLTQRSELFYLTKYDPKVWFFLIWLKELNTFLTWLKELNFFLQVTQRSELFIWQNMTQRFDFFWYDSKNRTLFWMWLKELNLFFLNMIQRIEPSSQKDSKKWFFHNFFKDLNPFFNMTHRIEPFLNNMTHWDWTLLFNMSQRKWLICCMSQRFSSFFAKCMTQRMNWSFLENMTLRIEIFERKTDSKNWTFSKIDSMDWTFCFTWPKELNFFFLYNSKDWTFFSFKPFFNNSTQWLTLFWTWLKELSLSFQDDSKNWTYDMTQSTNWIFFFKKKWRKELNVFWIWLTELNHFFLFLNMTPRIEFFVNICFFQEITDLNPFQHDSEKMNRISKIWLKELNPLHKRTQRIGP